ncbi:MAG: hypothetical protein K2Y39_10560 [Candidatus Obscuribacterales bacterium]|nr:hypothetical protein [Candidatus Obscuribacterales bacterium]
MSPEAKDSLVFLLAIVVAVLWLVASAMLYVPMLYICLGCGGIAYAYWAYRHGRIHWAKIEYEDKKYEKAIKLCEMQMHAFPKDEYPRALAAYSAYFLRDYQRTVIYASQALALRRENADLLLIRAEANLFLRRYEQCRIDITEAMKLGKTSWVIPWIRANVLIQMYDYELAMSDVDSQLLVQTRPDLASLLRASILQAKNQNAIALAEVESLMGRVSSEYRPSALMLRGLIKCNLGNYDSAIDDINVALDVQPDWSELYINKGYIMARKGDLNGAVMNLALAKEKETAQSSGYVESNEARIHLISGHAERAVMLSSQAVELGPSRAALNSTHGLMLLRNSRIEEAKTFLDKAIAQDPYEAEAFWFRAELYEKMGDTETAKKDQRIALDYGYIPYL